MKERFTVVFLGDQNPPTRLLLLQRGSSRKFAPNRFTGIGGHVENGEEPSPAALRELAEETEPSITDVSVAEFGRLIVNDGKIIHYYIGQDDGRPLPNSNEGTLFRVPIPEIQSKDLIPTTRWFIEEWAKRSWETSKPFTVYIRRDNLDDVNSPSEIEDVKEGLHDLT